MLYIHKSRTTIEEKKKSQTQEAHLTAATATSFP